MRHKKNCPVKSCEAVISLKAKLFKRVKLSLALLLGLGLTLQAQESVNITGGNVSGSGGSVSYSLGQVVYTTTAGTNGSVAKGVQQPFEITVVGIEEAEDINLMVLAYPNPATDMLTLEVKDFKPSTLTFQLFDMRGNLLRSAKIKENQTSILFSDLLSATYFIRVSQGNKEVKTFKIIKN